MTYKEDNFEDYLHANIDIHDSKIRQSITDNLDKHQIIYGPSGVGKYTLCLSALQNISPSKLKYFKKLHVCLDKHNIIINMSDIHYELDMSILTYNSRGLWNDIIQQILDSIHTPTPKTIICKEFHETPYDLLDIFYVYMQEPKIRFIMITTAIGFIPTQITNLCSSIIEVPRPTKCKYTSILKKKPNSSNNIINLKYPDNSPFYIPICSAIITYMVDISNFDYLVFRNLLYELLVYNLDIHACIWFILKTIMINNFIPTEDINEIILETIEILSKYNNNYHNIYHIECYCCYLVSKIHHVK
jgi:hypothetical protein